MRSCWSNEGAANKLMPNVCIIQSDETLRTGPVMLLVMMNLKMLSPSTMYVDPYPTLNYSPGMSDTT
jgi:hypothetical protein